MRTAGRDGKQRLSPMAAAREGNLVRMAMLVLGREKALAFLNDENVELGGRPIDIGTASESGIERVERGLASMTYKSTNRSGE